MGSPSGRSSSIVVVVVIDIVGCSTSAPEQMHMQKW
jgi:hypothetical protein